MSDDPIISDADYLHRMAETSRAAIGHTREGRIHADRLDGIARSLSQGQRGAMSESQLATLCAALGWQGGTYWQVVDEIRTRAVYAGLLHAFVKDVSEYTGEAAPDSSVHREIVRDLSARARKLLNATAAGEDRNEPTTTTHQKLPRADAEIQREGLASQSEALVSGAARAAQAIAETNPNPAAPLPPEDSGLHRTEPSGGGRAGTDATVSAEQRLWLWKNFVDGRPEYWAFDNGFPVHDNGDPQTLGEPCGYAILKPSRNGRPDVSFAAILRRCQNAKPTR